MVRAQDLREEALVNLHVQTLPLPGGFCHRSPCLDVGTRCHLRCPREVTSAWLRAERGLLHPTPTLSRSPVQTQPFRLLQQAPAPAQAVTQQKYDF